MRIKTCRWLVFAGAVLLATRLSYAQTPVQARLLVTVLDPSGSIVPDATVTLTRVENATPTATLTPIKSSARGVAIFDGLAPGRYTIEAAFPGFEPAVLEDTRLQGGDNRRTLSLRMQKIEETVTLAVDAQAAAANPKGGAFGATLTSEEIALLSSDRSEMAQQLIEMAGGNAVIKVDGFTGAPLPPKSQIKLIHIVRDTFAAENHSAESDEIEIITQPGTGPLEGGLSTRIRDGSMTARSPFTPTKGPERSQTFEGNLAGTIARNKSSFAVQVEGRHAFDTPILTAATPGGTVSHALGLRRPNNNYGTYDLFDYAVSPDHIVRVAYDMSHTTRENLGIGAYDLPERAYATTSSDHELRLQETGTFGRRAYLATRLQIQRADLVTRSALEAPTVRVNDAFTSGGAQLSGGRHSRDFELASDLDYIRGPHSIRMGMLFNGGRYRSDDAANYLGTYTFSSLEAFTAAQAASYLLRVGNPLVEYWNLRAGLYWQDDWRVRKGLTVSLGARYEAQTHVADYDNIAPRAGVTWAPFKSGRTSIRASAGLFYTWMGAATYEQTLRVDGVRQRELAIVNPAFPDPGVSGEVSATNRYLLGSELRLPRTLRISSGVDQRLSAKVRLNVLFSHMRAAGIMRGRNLNAPVNGVRPDRGFANVVEVVDDGKARTTQLQAGVNVNFAAGRAATKSRVSFHRASLRATYFLARADNNSDGPFWIPASGTLDTEWGPAPGDRRHRVSTSFTSTAVRHLSTTLTLAANSGTPYALTTGADDNGDSVFNDRPARVGRNTLRTTTQWTVSSTTSYTLLEAESCKLSLNANINNLTNRANFGGFSGVRTSPFFLRPTNVTNPRRVDIGLNVTF